jgi:hypothetical protein
MGDINTISAPPAKKRSLTERQLEFGASISNGKPKFGLRSRLGMEDVLPEPGIEVSHETSALAEQIWPDVRRRNPQ